MQTPVLRLTDRSYLEPASHGIVGASLYIRFRKTRDRSDDIMDAYIFFSTVLDMRRHVGLDPHKQDTVLVLHDSRGDEVSLRSLGIEVHEYFSHKADTQHWASELYGITNNNSLEKLSIRFGLGGFAVPIAHNPGNDARKTMQCAVHMLHHDYETGRDAEHFNLRQRNVKIITMDL